MRARFWIPVALFLAGVAAIIAAAATGEVDVQLLVIFPVISGSSWLFILGVALIIGSFVVGFLLVASVFSEYEPVEPQIPSEPRVAGSKTPARKTGYGGVVLIGPVPIVFGSDRRVTMAMLIVAVVLFAIILAITLLGLW